MSDNKYTFFDPPRKVDYSAPKLDIVEKIQEIFSGSSPVNQQLTLDSDSNQSIENTSEVLEESSENIQQVSEAIEEVKETLCNNNMETYNPDQYPIQQSDDQDKAEQPEILALPKPKLVEKIEEIFEQLPTKEQDSEELLIPDVIQEIIAIPVEDDQCEEKVTVESNVTKTEVTFHSPDCHHSPKRCVSVTGGHIESCESTVVPTGPIQVVPLVAKIPVVISEFQITLNLHSIITLPEPALEIKEISKSTKLTQCLLIQEPDVTLVAGDSSNLFLKGFIRKNISYATRDCSNIEGVCGDIKHCTVDIPFNCVTTVTFITPPIAPISNSLSEFQYFLKQNLSDKTFAEKDQLLSGDFSEFNQMSTEHFNELPFCELISSRIVEYDEFLGRRELTCKAPFEEKEFKQIEEKLVLTIQVKLLQNQQVPLGPEANS